VEVIHEPSRSLVEFADGGEAARAALARAVAAALNLPPPRRYAEVGAGAASAPPVEASGLGSRAAALSLLPLGGGGGGSSGLGGDSAAWGIDTPSAPAAPPRVSAAGSRELSYFAELPGQEEEVEEEGDARMGGSAAPPPRFGGAAAWPRLCLAPAAAPAQTAADFNSGEQFVADADEESFAPPPSVDEDAGAPPADAEEWDTWLAAAIDAGERWTAGLPAADAPTPHGLNDIAQLDSSGEWARLEAEEREAHAAADAAALDDALFPPSPRGEGPPALKRFAAGAHDHPLAAGGEFPCHAEGGNRRPPRIGALFADVTAALVATGRAGDATDAVIGAIRGGADAKSAIAARLAVLNAMRGGSAVECGVGSSPAPLGQGGVGAAGAAEDTGARAAPERVVRSRFFAPVSQAENIDTQ
jgi:hypothetical protein